MSIITKLLTGDGGVIGKVTGIVGKAVTDKDKVNEMVYEIALLIMQSKIAPYVRAALSLITLVGCMFFGDQIKMDQESQKWIIRAIFGFYFLDRFLNKK